MPHLEHDRLVFLALGETEADAGESTHLDNCAHCRTEMDALRHVAGLGADAQGLHALPDPPEHVWQGIVAEIRAAEALPALPGPRAEPALDERPSGGQPSDRRSDGEGGVVLAPPRGRWSRWAVTAATAAAAAVLGVVGTVAVLDATEPTPEPTPRRVVLASAPLKAYGATPPEANGEARVFDNGRLHLHVANLPDVPGYYEVWLINPRNMEMFSVGVLGDAADELLPLPPNVDLEAYSVVDVSAEAYDNNTAHSGKSLLRGTLTG
ncbi:anti-sigma factor [Micromonospora sp. URMC 107]|uniref:anti-sigma factor n=1 Tax=Micromonospora sp. URMC 107 TaxID=3423418 RepID=UPI003F1D892F